MTLVKENRTGELGKRILQPKLLGMSVSLDQLLFQQGGLG